MPPLKTTYRKYPTGLKIQFAQNALSKDCYKNISRSTRQGWKKYNVEQLYTPSTAVIYDSENVELLKALAEIQRLKKFIRGMAYLIVVYKKLLSQFDLERKNILSVHGLAVACVQYLQFNFPQKQFWIWMPFSSHQWSAWNSRAVCKLSLLQLCRRKHPHQLTTTEINAIKKTVLIHNTDIGHL